MNILRLLIKEMNDRYVRQNFQRIQDYTDKSNILRGNLEFVEIEFTQAETNYKYKHNLDFTPNLAFLAWVSDGAAVTLNYDEFDSDNIDITVDQACTIRLFIGSYKKT